MNGSNQFLCKLIGHKVTSHDWNYPVCDRCSAHGYYDDRDFCVAWHYWPYRLFVWIAELPESVRDWRFNRRMDNSRPLSEDEIPF